MVTEHLDWVAPRVDYTKRLAAAVALSCRETRSLASIAKQFGLHVLTVKKMDKEALEQELPDPSESSPRLLGVDEFSIKKRHHYATAVEDLENKTVPYLAEGRSKESLAGFYRALGEDKCKRIEAVAMDMWPAYEEATREHCPNAELVYDFFHVVMAYGRDVIDKVRRQEYARAGKEEKEVFIGRRYLLLKNRRNLDPSRDEPARLSELLRLNRNLAVVYTLKDDLKELWRYRSPAWARKWFDGWYEELNKTKPVLLDGRYLYYAEQFSNDPSIASGVVKNFLDENNYTKQTYKRRLYYLKPGDKD